MTTKLLLMGIITAGILGAGAADAATLATEGFVRSGIANAKAYADSIVGAIVVPSLEGYATENYVNTAIGEISIPSTAGLATETYVDNAVSGIAIPSLTGYATETYVDTAIGEINIPSVAGLATEAYVNSQVATKENTIVGAAGQVLVGTGTGFTWMATTGETFTE